MARIAVFCVAFFAYSWQACALLSLRSSKTSQPEAGDNLLSIKAGALVPGGQIQVPQWSNVTASGDCPDMFVVVMSKRDSLDTRAQIRYMWHHASAGWGSVVAKFGICARKPETEPSDVTEKLKHEEMEHDDLLLLDCEEGYLKGLLTLKTIAAMAEFAKRDDNRKLFMKTDDDAFVAFPRLCKYLNSRGDAETRFDNSYIGLFAEDGEWMDKQYAPCRDPDSDWYEPFENYDRDYWPVCAKGGPGYILSRELVTGIMDIAPSKVLYNEDKAVGVWVDELTRNGYEIQYTNLPGTDGYTQFHEHIKTWGAWDFYPYVVHHHLNANEITCLYQVELHGDLVERVDQCFTEHKSVKSIEGEMTRLSATRNLPTHDELKKTYYSERHRRTLVGAQKLLAQAKVAQVSDVEFNVDEMTSEEMLSCMGHA